MVIMLLLIGVLFGGIFGYQQFVASMMQQFLASNTNPPVTVTAMQAQHESWQPQLSAVGTLRALQGVKMRSELSGIVERVHFKSGQIVKQGDLLLELNDDEERAHLQALQASRKLAEINLSRDRQQLKINAISQAKLDSAESELKSRQAQEAQQQAIILKKQIRAPFSGQLGISQIDIGQLLNPGEVIVTLQNTQRLYVDFNLPQQQLGKLRVGQRLTLRTNDEVVEGVINTINAEVDVRTRNVRVEGVMDNQQGRWLPGMFVHLKVDSGEPQTHLTLPQTAISYNAYGATLFKVEPAATEDENATAQQVFVITGARRGDQVAILDGIVTGDQVVTSGQMKLKNGTPLIIDNTLEPSNETAPTPQEQ
ncbi:MAG: efflux RND transporter periplasmic adaptor subunit [Gammaproteobacteria bacterium]|nr:efflux RND transporter periplasmic adaptor subunit [Gammaproteobacteria bacterium]MBT3488731.1 efflux RND transporter periplasmic adaptor subunit [Gammaproteobacteria bacterium]MBT3717982.1 efflux RND transporter periplasmic adaptor subunit [Gammaproteobacteria bacterium]MBT3845434.1 efflux RND transporter periplasmic adaptor subunit [Gammaproteobacteria bacterium]MBT3893941.1 efflux RND transporter periplasmic adaptor subunit [Gammaproteobacteria bacterium]